MFDFTVRCQYCIFALQSIFASSFVAKQNCLNCERGILISLGVQIRRGFKPIATTKEDLNDIESDDNNNNEEYEKASIKEYFQQYKFRPASSTMTFTRA